MTKPQVLFLTKTKPYKPPSETSSQGSAGTSTQFDQYQDRPWTESEKRRVVEAHFSKVVIYLPRQLASLGYGEGADWLEGLREIIEPGQFTLIHCGCTPRDRVLDTVQKFKLAGATIVCCDWECGATMYIRTLINVFERHGVLMHP